MSSPCSQPQRPGRFVASLSIAFGCVLSLPATGQQAVASDGFETIISERAEMENLRQFLDLNLKLGNVGEAKRYAHKILARNSRDVDALGALLGIHLKSRDAKEALRYAKRYRSVRPGAASDALYASALRLNGEKHEALGVMLRSYASVPESGFFFQLPELGYCYYDCRNIEEARRCFIKIRDDKRFSQKQRSQAVRELAGIRREAEIREAYLAIEQRDLKGARRIATALASREKKPHRDVEALIAVLDADERGKVKEAVAAFERLKSKHKGTEPFPYQSTYAILLLDQGRYAEAEAAAREAARVKNPYLTAEDERGRLDTMRMVRQFSRSLVSGEALSQSQSEGHAYRAKVEGSLPINQMRSRIGAEVQINELDFDKSVAGADQTSYQTAYATLSHQFSPTSSARVAAGTVAGNFAYRIAARLARATKANFLEIAIEGGQRPRDSMAVEAFKGEEHRATLKGRVELPAIRRLRLAGEAFVRTVDVEHSAVSKLGDGWGARWEAEYLFYKFQRTMVSVAYVGSVQRFDYSGPALQFPALGIVEDDLHQHGIAVRARMPVGSSMMAHAELGANYRFDDDQFTYSAAGGLEWWISEFTRLTADAAYYTSGLAGNAGSGSFEGRVGVSSSF